MDKPERVEQILQLEPPHELRFKGELSIMVEQELFCFYDYLVNSNHSQVFLVLENLNSK